MGNIKNEIDSEKRFEKRLAKEAKQRDYKFSERTGLLDFGHNLFKYGYIYDDFVTDVIIIYIYPIDKAKELYNMLLEKYNKIENFLTYEQVVSLATNSNYLENILIGYNTEKRRSNISKSTKKH